MRLLNYDYLLYVKYNAIKVLFLYFNLCLNIMFIYTRILGY